jgi:hypothetical protein
MSEDLTKNLQGVDDKLTLVLSTVQALAVRVDNVEQIVKVRLYETEPLLRKIIAAVAQLQEGQGRLEEGQESLRSELKAFRRVVDYRFLILSGTVLDRYNKLEQRVTHLELNSSPPNTET